MASWHDFCVNFRRTKSHEPSLEIFRTNEEFLMKAALSQNTFYLVKSIIHNLYHINYMVFHVSFTVSMPFLLIDRKGYR